MVDARDLNSSLLPNATWFCAIFQLHSLHFRLGYADLGHSSFLALLMPADLFMVLGQDETNAFVSIDRQIAWSRTWNGMFSSEFFLNTFRGLVIILLFFAIAAIALATGTSLIASLMISLEALAEHCECLILFHWLSKCKDADFPGL